MAEREWERAGGEAAATGVRGGGDTAEPTGGERGASLDENTAERRERRGEPAPPSERVTGDPADNPSVGGAEGTSVGGPADDAPPDPYGT